MKLLAMLMMAADLNGQPLPEVVLLDFHAAYCQPCQQMVPVLQRMERDKFPIRKIDITENPDVSKQYKVDRIPTLILLVEGQEAQRFVGLTAEEELRAAMNKAARSLDEQRKAAGGLPVAESENEIAAVQPALSEEETTESPSGIRGIFDRMKKGLTGGPARGQIERPSYRAQSPDAIADTAANRAAMQATVRVRLIDGKMRDFGTGTIVHSTAGQSTILTCAHVFKGVSADAAVVIDVFRDGQVLKYPATVVGGDHDSDVAFLKIQNTTPLSAAPIARQLGLQQSDAVFSIGCNNGEQPTRMDMNVVAVNRYEGPENVVCTKDPIQGRSGGGLFNTSGELVGVCSGAFRKAQEGLYSGVKPVIQLAGLKSLGFLFDSETPAFGSNDPSADLMADVESPFSTDDAIFDELMNENVADFSNNAPIVAPDFGNMTPQNLPDPFAPPPALPAMSTTAESKLPTEITIIIDSKDPTKEKQVVVIPKPSPWLLRLLTGEPNGAGESMTAAGGTAFSATGARRTTGSGSRATNRTQRH